MRAIPKLCRRLYNALRRAMVRIEIQAAEQDIAILAAERMTLPQREEVAQSHLEALRVRLATLQP